MQNLAELDRLIHGLMRLRDDLAAEKNQVIAEMRHKISQYQLTATEIGLGADPAPARPELVLQPTAVPEPDPERPTGARDRRKARYRDEAGNVWHGGRGRHPTWVRRILDAGGDLERYRVPAA